MDALMQGPRKRERHSTEGNLALLVLVDSQGDYHSRSIVDETVLVALEHFGFPYRLLDLANQRPVADLFANCAGLVVAQEGVCGRLSNSESQLIADAVADGMGLFNLDWDLRGYKGPLLEIFGFEGVNRQPIATNVFRVPSNDHYITWLQESNAFHESRRMVTALTVQQWGRDVTPLVEAILGKEQLVYIRHLVPYNAYEPGHTPVFFGANWGRGRAVQSIINPRLWRLGALGHLGGMTDLFWRSITWSARKPFVANMIPPFVTMSFDDCRGEYDFQYLDACTRFGYVPLVGIFLDDVQERHISILRDKVKAGEISLNTHGGFSYYRRLSYDFGVGKHSQEQLAQNFAEEDNFYQKHQLEHCKTIRGHFGEMGTNALPFFKERGRTLFTTPINIGERKADQFIEDGYWPFNTRRCFYDNLPDDNDFLIHGAFNERHLADFLTGTTIWLRESTHNNLDAAAGRAAEQIRNGLSNGFYGDVVTHEQKLVALSMDEWEKILALTEQKVSRFERLFVSIDHIGEYLRNKDRCNLQQVNMVEGSAQCKLEGTADIPLQLSIFEDVEDGVERRFISTPLFKGVSDLIESG